MRHLLLASLACTLLFAPGCATRGPVLELSATASRPLELAWETEGLELKLELAAGAESLRVEQRGGVTFVYWGSRGGMARFEAVGGRIRAEVGNTLTHPKLDPADLPLRAIGSGEFRSAVSLRLHPEGEVTVLAAANKWDAKLARRWAYSSSR